MKNDHALNIYEENGLYGAKDQNGQIVIAAQYTEMYPFSCGLSMVRNNQNQYAYIDYANNLVIPFDIYSWCDPQFVCGYARVLKDKWGIINTKGDLIVPLKYDKIWALNEEHLCSIKAYVGKQEESINLLKVTSSNILLDGLTYIATYSVQEFKELTNCNQIHVKKNLETNQLFFTYGTNIGAVAISSIPEEPAFSIVCNSNGKTFVLLTEKRDVGKTSFSTLYVKGNDENKKQVKKQASNCHKTSFWDYENEKMNDNDNWSDPYGDERAIYDGWSREDVESGLADAYE